MAAMNEETTSKIRYAIYTRQSVRTPAQFASCDAQFETCLERIQQQGDELAWVGVRFDDPGESGTTLERPAMQRLRRAVAERAMDRVYVTALDRLSRSTRDLGELLREFEAAGVQLYLAQSLEMIGGANVRFIAHILASFAQFEREMIASRIADTRAAMKQQGMRLAGPPPFGYNAHARTKQLKQVLTEANQVRAIFKLAANGNRPAAIAETINSRGWRTRTARQIVELLRNPVYVGRFRDGKGTRPGYHKPIVDAALFGAVQAALDSRRTTTAPRGHIADWPLRGKLMCPKCGRAMSSYMVTHGNKQAKKVYRYYRCRATAGGRPACRGAQYPAYEIHKVVSRMLSDDSNWRGLLARRRDLAQRAATLRETWCALGESEQWRVLAQIVDCVRLDDRRGTVSVDFKPALFDLVARAAEQSRARRTRRRAKGDSGG